VSIKNILLPEYHFVYTYYFGKIDDIQVRAYSDQIKKDLAAFSRYCEIIDFSREVDFSSLSSETLNRAGALEKERPLAGSGPLAILVTDPLTYGLARTYSTFAADSRTDVLISYKFEDCLAFMGFKDHQRLIIEQAIHQDLAAAGGLYPGSQLEFHFPKDH